MRLGLARGESAESEGGQTPSSDGDGPRPPSLPPKPRKKRIGEAGRASVSDEGGKRPRLFGGSLEEYVEGTGEEIPLVVRSTVRLLTTHGLHHQGVFRVSGSQLEIAAFKEAFERGAISQSPWEGGVESVVGV